MHARERFTNSRFSIQDQRLIIDFNTSLWRQISVKITLPSVYLEGIVVLIGVWLC